MSEWQELRVKDLIQQGIIEKPLDGNHGEIHPKGEDFVASGIPFVMASDINGGKVDLESCKFITEQQASSLRKGFAKAGDVLLTHKASLGRTALVPRLDTDYIMLTPQVTYYRIKDKARLLNSYLKYYFDSPFFQDTLTNHGDAGSTRAYIGITAQHELPIILPPLPEQKAIASVLSSLDDKIDLLHRQNKTLEAMADTLFHQWFIEEAKEDWSEFYIRDLEIYIADYVANGSFASLKENVTLITERSDYALFIRNTDLKSNFANKVYVDEHSYNFLVKTKLYGGEVIISNVADVGSVHLCPRFNIPMTLGNNIIMLRSKFNYFLYLYFTSNVGQDALYAITSGSAQQKFNKTDFRALKISLPNLAILDEFNELVSPYFIKKEYNLNQIQTLENLRDTLLPKLMSGEVRVQYQTEEVA